MHSNTLFTLFLALAALLFPALAQAPYDPSAFNIAGVITGMSLKGNGAGGPLNGGVITVNGIPITVPDNTIATLPSYAVAWPELFVCTAGSCVPQLPGTQSWTATVVGNRVNDEYRAGLVYISANPGIYALQGFITSINPATGHFTVGGAFPAGGIDCVINDPFGIYAPIYTANPLWGVDPTNPSIHAQTGFPMCIPRSATFDPLCPTTNRPIDPATKQPVQIFTYKDPATNTLVAGVDPDPRYPAPLMVGDYVTFTGQQVGSTYEVNSLEANVGLFTAPGSKPSYITVENVQIAITSPATGNVAIGETKAVAWTTDPSATLSWFAQDVNPCTGAITERLITTLQAENAAPPIGRAVFRLGKIPMSPSTRNVIFRLTSGTTSTYTVNNFTAGEFTQPVFGFNFPELTVAGSPMVPNAFEAMPFLALGSGPYVPGNPLSKPLATPPIIGQLSPWPGNPIPASTSCPAVAVAPAPTPTPTTTTAVVAATPTPSPDTITIISATQTKARQGNFQIDVTATSNNFQASLFLTIAGSNPLPNPLTNAPMTNLGNGKFTLTAQIKAVGLKVTVTSDKGGTPKSANI